MRETKHEGKRSLLSRNTSRRVTGYSDISFLESFQCHRIYSTIAIPRNELPRVPRYCSSLEFLVLPDRIFRWKQNVLSIARLDLHSQWRNASFENFAKIIVQVAPHVYKIDDRMIMEINLSRVYVKQSRWKRTIQVASFLNVSSITRARAVYVRPS